MEGDFSLSACFHLCSRPTFLTAFWTLPSGCLMITKLNMFIQQSEQRQHFKGQHAQQSISKWLQANASPEIGKVVERGTRRELRGCPVGSS